MSDPEKSVIGACLHTAKAIVETATILNPDDFYTPAHEIIYDTILTMHRNGDPVDPITVESTIRSRGELERIGGNGVLFDLYTAVPTASNVGFYARTVADQAARRRVHAAGKRIQLLAESGEPVDQVLHHATAEIGHVTAKSVRDLAPMVGEVVDDVLEELSTPFDDSAGILWPWVDANNTLNRLSPGQLLILAARPAVGKSLACVQVAWESAKKGVNTTLHTLEMSRSEVVKRIIAAEARVLLTHIQERRLTEGEWERVAKARETLANTPLRIEDNPTAGLAELHATVERYEPGLIVFDYLQQAAVNAKLERRLALEEFTRGLKVLAMKAQIPILVAAQLNRSSEHRPDGKPILADLRETGAIEQDADTVILMHRPELTQPETPRAGEADLIVAKQRNGPTGTISLGAQLHYARLVDMAH